MYHRCSTNATLALFVIEFFFASLGEIDHFINAHYKKMKNNITIITNEDFGNDKYCISGSSALNLLYLSSMLLTIVLASFVYISVVNSNNEDGIIPHDKSYKYETLYFTNGQLQPVIHDLEIGVFRRLRYNYIQLHTVTNRC